MILYKTSYNFQHQLICYVHQIPTWFGRLFGLKSRNAIVQDSGLYWRFKNNNKKVGTWLSASLSWNQSKEFPDPEPPKSWNELPEVKVIEK